MPTRPEPRRLSLTLTITLTIVGSLLAALAGVLGNIASSKLPDGLTPYVWLAWPTLGIVVLLGTGITVWLVVRDTRMASSSPRPQPVVSAPAPTAVGAPTQASTGSYHACVLSYATGDQPFAEQLHADLALAGVSCWFAPQELKQGDKLRDEIFAAIRKPEKLLLVLSHHAIESKWVEEEVDAALDWEHQHPGTLLLFPLRLDEQVFQTEKAWAVTVRQRFIGDFQRWQEGAAYQRAFQRLLRDLKR